MQLFNMYGDLSYCTEHG